MTDTNCMKPDVFSIPCYFTLIILFLSSILASQPCAAQRKWDGGGGDGRWNTAANWSGDQVPAEGDDIVLDNETVGGNYIVHLPGGSDIVSIRSLRISPFTGNHIQLELPASSTASPAVSLTGPGYGIIIDNGAVLLNASDTNAGAAIIVADSMRINNGGVYVHNTRSAHAALVSVLSRQPEQRRGCLLLMCRAAGTLLPPPTASMVH